MMPSQHVLLDLSKDLSENVRTELISAVRTRLGDSPDVCVTAIATDSSVGELPYPNVRVVSSSSPLQSLFDTKTQMDQSDVLEFLMVTSRPHKKFWERVLHHLFSPLHVWAVMGVEVTGQALPTAPPDGDQVEAEVMQFLQSVPGQGEITIRHPDVIPQNLFNAGYSLRTGGVSRYPSMASLNLLYTQRKVDSLEVVTENRRRLAGAAGFDLARLSIARTAHHKDVWVVGKEEPPATFDGLVTDYPGHTLAAGGADCCVILLADVVTGACGAVHSGWRGTTLGAVKCTLSAMMEHFGTRPSDIRASVGPSVEGACFDLPAEDAQPIIDLDPTLTWPSKAHVGWVHVDLPRANALMLEAMGVSAAHIDLSTAECTACHKDTYYSHRRDGVPFGNQWGFISCRERPPTKNGPSRAGNINMK